MKLVVDFVIEIIIIIIMLLAIKDMFSSKQNYKYIKPKHFL